MIHSISYQGYNVYYTVQGSGQPIAFLHGWPTNSQLWQAQVELFKKKFRVITIDWLGFGKSDKPLDFKYTFTHKKEILNKVLSEALKSGEKITIVAHDIGGPPSVLWASENEEKLTRLILLNTVAYPFQTKLDATSEVLFRLPLIGDVLLSTFGLKNIMKSNTKSKRKELNKQIESIVYAYKNEKVALKRKTISGPLEEGRKHEILTIPQKFKALNIPKHLIIAKQDPLCYKHIKKLSEENPEVPVHNIENCGHYIPIDQPEVLNQILLSIVKGQKE